MNSETDINTESENQREVSTGQTLSSIQSLSNSKENDKDGKIIINNNKIYNMNIIFKISSGEEIEINTPSNITIQKLIGFFVQKMQIEKYCSNIIFIFHSEVLNELSQDLLSLKLKNNDIITISDEGNIININGEKLNLIYEEY